MPSRPPASFKNKGGELYVSESGDYTYGPDVLSAAKVCSTDGKFSAQNHQKFVSQYLAHKGSLLVYHGLGSGKTCTAILGAEMFKPTYKGRNNQIFKVAGAQKVMIVCPANLIKQTKLEVYGACSSSVHYDTVPQTYNDKPQTFDAEIEQIQKDLAAAQRRKDQTQIGFEKERLAAAKEAKNTFIDNAFKDNYEFYSYEKFTNNLFKDTKDTKKGKGPLLRDDNAITKGGLLIIDEVQNVVSEEGNWHSLIQHALNHYAHKDLRIALLSATPIMNQPGDLGLTLNLLNPEQPFPTTLRGFKECFVQETKRNDMVIAQGVKNDKKLRQMCANKVSYIAGGNPHEYPYTINTVVHHEMTKPQMGVYQEKIGLVLQQYYKNVDRILGYRKGDKKEKDEVPQLWPGPQMIANVYEDGELLSAMRQNVSDAQKMDIIKNYSPKFHSIIQLMKKTDRPVFVHSNYVTEGGVLTLLGCLQGIGWNLYNSSTGSPVTNGKTVGLFIGANKNFKETTPEAKARMTKVFNSPENMNGKHIKLIIGTVKEGLSLKNVGQVHMIDPWWNMNKLKQIAARAVRYGSHCGLPESKRYVHIFTHLSTLPDNKPHAALKALIQIHVSKVLADRPSLKDDTRNPKNTSLNNMWKASIDQVMFKSAQKKYTLSNKFDNILKYCAVDRDLNASANAKAVEEYYYPHPSMLDKYVQLKHDPLTGDYFVRNKTERTTTFGDWVSLGDIVNMDTGCTDFKRYLETRNQSSRSRAVRPPLHKYQVRVSRDDTGDFTLKEPVMPKDYSDDLIVTMKDQFITKENIKFMKFEDKEADEECLRILETAKATIQGATSTVSQANNTQAKKDEEIKLRLERLYAAYSPGTTLQPGKTNEQLVLYILKNNKKASLALLKALKLKKLPKEGGQRNKFAAQIIKHISQLAALEALVNAA